MLLKVSLMLALACFYLCAAADGMCTEKIPNEENIPPGSYKTSCWACAVATDDDNELLTCECEDSQEELRRTYYYLDGSCIAFKNIDGKLICDEEIQNPDYKQLPKGAYLDECGKCTFNGATRLLECDACRDKAGGLHKTSLQVPKENCDIVCDMGNLRCKDPEDTKTVKNEQEGKFEL